MAPLPMCFQAVSEQSARTFGKLYLKGKTYAGLHSIDRN